jgi:rubrerythrin
MADIKTVMSWLEGLTQDDWRMYYSDSEVQEIAKATLALLKEQEPVKPINVYMYRKMFVNVRSGYCPICNNPVDEEEGNNFCCSCGRRLNWDA